MKALVLVAAGAALAVLLVVLVVAGGLWWLRRKLRRLGEALASIGPATITLEPRREPLPEECARRGKAFAGLGFAHAGSFDLAEMEGVAVDGWAHETESAYAVVYSHPRAGVWSDVATFYRDAGGLTVSNAAQGGVLDHMPGWRKVYAPGASEEELWRRFLVELPAGAPRAPATGARFAADFAAAYRLEMEWRLGRGGATLEEVRRVAEAEPGRFDPETVAQAHAVIEAEARTKLTEACREAVAATVSGAEWERLRDRLVVVHERLGTEDATEALVEALRHEAVDEAATERFEQRLASLAREAVPVLEWPERVAELLPPSARWQVHACLRQPVKAVVLVLPPPPA